MLALGLGSAACGSDEDGSDGGAAEAGDGIESALSTKQGREVSAAYDRFVNAIADHRWRDACDSYTARYLAAYPKQIKLAGNCTDTMKLEFSAITSRKIMPRVYMMRAHGPRAVTVMVKESRNEDGAPLSLVVEDGRWKIDGVADRIDGRDFENPDRPS